LKTVKEWLHRIEVEEKLDDDERGEDLEHVIKEHAERIRDEKMKRLKELS